MRRGDDILVFEDQDSVKHDRYCRPLGGGIEFGEHSRDAVIREFREEIEADLVDVRLLDTLESIFECDGISRHEIIWVYEGRLSDEAFYHQASLDAWEDNGLPMNVTWRNLRDIEAGEIRLVPEGLLELLNADARGETQTAMRI